MMKPEKDDIEAPPPQEEQAPPQNPRPPSVAKKSSGSPKVSKWVKIGLAASAVAAIGLGVGLGVGLSQRNANASAASATSASQADDEETTTTTTPIGEWDPDIDIDAAESRTGSSSSPTTPTTATTADSSSSSTSTSSSTSMSTTIATAPVSITTATTTSAETPTTTTTAATIPSTPSSGEGAETTTTTVSTDPTDDEGTDLEAGIAKSQIYTSSDSEEGSVGGETDAGDGGRGRPLQWQFRTFSQEIIDEYPSCADLEADLMSAANFLAERVIAQNADRDRYYPMPEDGDMETAAPVGAEQEEGADADFSDEAGDSSAAKEADAPPGGGETDFETNVQVEGVDEIDVVKANIDHVFTAYGDTIVMWNAVNGEVLSSTVMPPPETVDDFDDEDCYYYAEPMPEPSRPVEIENEEVDDLDKDDEDGKEVDEEGEGEQEGAGSSPAVVTVGAPAPASSAATSSATSAVSPGPEKKSIAIDPCYHRHRPRTTIRGLLLHENRLVAFVQGYEPLYYHWSTPAEDQPILSGYGTTHVKVFDTSAFEDVQVEDEDEKGNTVTVTRRQLVQVSEQELFGEFKSARAIGSRIHSVTMSNVNTYPHIERHLSRWDQRYQGKDKDAYIAEARKVAKDVTANFVGKLLGEIRNHHGDDTGTVCENIARLSLFQTGDVGDPLSSGLYDDGRVFGGLAEVSSFDVESSPSAKLADGSPGPLPIRTSTAFVRNVWSSNIYATRDVLILATTGYDRHQQLGRIESTFVQAFHLPGGEGEDVSEAAQFVGVGSVPGTLLNQYSMDMYEGHLRIATSTRPEWGCVDKNGKVVEEPWKNGQRIPCNWEQVRDPHNQVTVLEVKDNKMLKQVGKTEGSLGKPGETITAVRFLGDSGFVVTFERIDPFFVLDLSDPKDPKVIGELEISGWSNYIHPTGDESNPTLLAVGQEANEQGRQLGLQISLFGFRDRANPRLLARAMAEDVDEGKGNQWSSSEVQFEAKAFRYLRKMKIALVPARVHGHWVGEVEEDEKGNLVKTERWEFFDGFYFFAVNTTAGYENVTKMFRVNMAHDYYGRGRGRCYGSGHMSARSLVYGGNATLIKGHSAQSWRLETQKKRWELNLDDNLPKGQCYDYWG